MLSLGDGSPGDPMIESIEPLSKYAHELQHVEPMRVRPQATGSPRESRTRLTAMVASPPTVRPRPVTPDSKAMDKRQVCSHVAGRLIQMALALYLVPALLIALAVGGVGMAVLTISRLFMDPTPRSVG